MLIPNERILETVAETLENIQQREGLYVKSLEAEADFNLVGRLRTRSEILYLLEAELGRG